MDCLEVVGLFFADERGASGDIGRAGRREEPLCGGGLC
jgi:hypothetical protein